MMLDDDGRLALAQALYKVCGVMVDTKDPDSLRGRMDAKYKLMYEQTGAKSFDLKINDQVVGTYSIKFSKPKDSEKHSVLEVKDFYSLAEYVTSIPDDVCRKYAESELAGFADWYFYETGEVPEGCELVEYVKPAVEKAYIGGSLRVKPEDVAKALGGQLTQGIAGMLEG